MINEEELQKLLADLESDRVERKANLGPSVKDKVGEAICAFANDLPGHKSPGLVFIGVDDSGHPTGLPITDQLLQNLAAFRSDGNILPLPSLTVQKHTFRHGEVAVVFVEPSNDPPVRYRGKVWIRVGPRRAVASRDEERILVEKRQSGDLPLDRRPVPGASLEDLDLRFFEESYLPAAVSQETLEENQRSLPEQVQALHLLSRDLRPSYAAILLLGKDPRSWLPGGYVQFARYDGTALDSPILDQKEISGRMDEVLRRLDEIAKINIRVPAQVEGVVTEERSPDYPLTALQQLLRNAALHRTYEVNTPIYWFWFSDRVEIHSPGGLYGRVNEENFGKRGATDYRNPTLAEGLKILGFVQRFGMGIELARRRCLENGNPAPKFELSPSAVLASIEGRA